MHRILMIAYHFPPVAGSSGIQRTLRFAQHLPEFGWEPLVLTVSPRAYERTSDDLMADVQQGMIVERAFALDTARHLSLGGRYIGAMARPDRWASWRFAGTWAGMGMIRRYAPDVIWSTYPIATAHMIGSALQRRSGLPWVADFRDPMAQAGYPRDPLTWKSFKSIEQDAIGRAALSTFTTPSAAAEYRTRYPQARERIVLLENGYDEESFVDAGIVDDAPLIPGVVTLLHSGIVYPEERDPSALFAALGRLKEAGRIRPDQFRIRFRAAAHDAMLREMAARFDVGDFVELSPAIPYREALKEMLRADALLVLQAAGCNAQVPAKLYEYLRANKPILALTDPAGDTAAVLRTAGVSTIARLDSADEIETFLPAFVAAIRNRTAPLPDREAVLGASRRGRTKELAGFFSKISGDKA
jgi:glycosyltransferase involved in cell wall biosynthesis